jgi:uncharacterized membrane protein
MNTILDNEFTFLTLLYGVLFVIAGVLYKILPPKKMSWYYGVQTKAARRNEQTWKEATLFVATPAICIGLLFILISFLPFIFESATIFSIRLAFILIFASLILLHSLTQRHLNRNFDKEGNKIQNA